MEGDGRKEGIDVRVEAGRHVMAEYLIFNETKDETPREKVRRHRCNAILDDADSWGCLEAVTLECALFFSWMFNWTHPECWSRPMVKFGFGFGKRKTHTRQENSSNSIRSPLIFHTNGRAAAAAGS
jgi:hypothetical protein